MSKKTPQSRVLFAGCRRPIGAVVFGVFLLSMAVSLLWQPGTPVQAATASTLNFQARLQSSSGAIVPDGYYNVQFKLYSASSGGTALWTETYYDSNGSSDGNDNRIRVRNGYLAANLGSLSAFGAFNWDQEMWITMNIGGSAQTASPTWDGEMNPRLKLTAVPYAFKAGDSAALGGIAASGFIQNGTALQTANMAIQSANASNVGAVLQGAASQSADILQVKANGVSSPLMAVGANGAVTLQNATDSASAFRVLNSGNGLVLGVNTSSNLVRITTGTVGNISLTSGSGALQIGGDATDNLALDDNEIMARNNGATSTLYLQKLGGGLNIQSSLTLVKPNANSTTAFQVQPAGSTTPVLNVDTANGRVGVGLSDPAYALSVVGDINTSTQYRVAGTAGATTTCSGGQFLQNAVVAGGIVTGGSCVSVSSGVTTVGTINSQTKSANGAVIAGTTIYMQTADASNPGLVSTGTQTFAGDKTFSGMLSADVNIASDFATRYLNNSATGYGMYGYVNNNNNTNELLRFDNSAGMAVSVKSNGNVSTVGSLSGVGVNANSGLLQGSGGVTVSGAVSINAGGSGNTSIGTGSNAGTVTIGSSTIGIGDATTDRLSVSAQIQGGSPLVFQGATDNAFTTTLSLVDPTANNTITLPNYSGTVVLSSNAGSVGECLKSNGATTTPSYGVCGTGNASTLQEAYNGSGGTTDPHITLASGASGLKIRDNATPVSGNLFQLQNSGGTATFFGVATSGMTLQNSSGNTTFNFLNATGELQLYAPGTANYARIYYSGTEAVFAASTGTTRIGNGSGNINLVLSNTADLLTANKTLGSLASAYSSNDFSFSRTFTAGSTSLQGSVVNIESITTGTNDSSNVLTLFQGNANNTGNLIVASKNGSGERFKVSGSGSVTIGGSMTIGSNESYTGSGAVSVSSGSGNLTLQAAGSSATVVKASTNSANSFNVQDASSNIEFQIDTSNGQYAFGANGVVTGARLGVRTTGTLDVLRLLNSSNATLFSVGSTGSVLSKASTASTTAFQVQNTSSAAVLAVDTSSSVNRVQIGSATSDATAMFLVLDSYNTATDPGGTAGAMYYNAATGKFRCYTTAWRECLTLETKRMTANVNSTSTTLAAISELQYTLSANTDYELECKILFQSTATANGLNMAVTTTATMSNLWWERTTYLATNGAGSLLGARSATLVPTATATVDVANADIGFKLSALIRVGAAGGTFAPTFASETGTSVSARTGSTCSLRQL